MTCEPDPVAATGCPVAEQCLYGNPGNFIDALLRSQKIPRLDLSAGNVQAGGLRSP